MKKISFVLISFLLLFVIFYFSGLKMTTKDTIQEPTDTAASSTKNVVDKSLGISYSYIDNFYINNNLTQYVHPVEWPPSVMVKNEELNCMNPGKKVQINGASYCIVAESEGAAGSTYTNYTYKKQFGTKVVVIVFVVRTPQCANYDEPKKGECEKEKIDLNIDTIVDKMFSTIKFAN